MKKTAMFLASGCFLLCATWLMAEDEQPGKKKGKQDAPNPGQVFQRFDKNNDGYLERSELPKPMQARFDQLDQDKDGKVSREEMVKAAGRFDRDRPPGAPPGHVPDPLFHLLDADHDGKLSAEELGKAKDLLKKMDKNKDGVIDRAELLPPGDGKPKFDQPGRPGEKGPMNPILERLDADKDGKISKAEAKGPLAENFERVDRNGDGFLDKEELAPVAARLWQKGKGDAKPPKDGAKDRPRILNFDDLDKSADGRLTKEEVAGTPLSDKFADIDTNGDGKIDPKEFKAFQEK